MANEGFKFNLGDKVKDDITGFEGVVYGRTEWFNGCNRYILWSTKLDKDNKVVELTFDEEQLTLVRARQKNPVKAVRTGGPFGSVTRPTVSR